MSAAQHGLQRTRAASLRVPLNPAGGGAKAESRTFVPGDDSFRF